MSFIITYLKVIPKWVGQSQGPSEVNGQNGKKTKVQYPSDVSSSRLPNRLISYGRNAGQEDAWNTLHSEFHLQQVIFLYSDIKKRKASPEQQDPNLPISPSLLWLWYS